MVLVLFETAVGFCLFRLSDAGKLTSPDLYKQFATPDSASSLLKLAAIHRFASAAEAVEDVAAVGEGKMSKGLKKFLAEQIVDAGKKSAEQLVVTDPKLGSSISKKLGINVVSDSSVLDLYRGIRTHLASLLSSSSTASSDGSLDPRDLDTMSLGLSHSLSRYKLKFSPDKVDMMVVQAVGLLDDLDKEVNIYAMRVKEWYGWHFPEMAKIITDNLAYAKCVRAMGLRTNAASTDFSEVLPEELEETLKAAAEVSMGTEISASDLEHISSLCEQVVGISAYRQQLWSYLQNRMAAIAPNLTALVGELVGARLISHAGSLMNLAKHPASTVQILGAEKALFRALKTKHDTPKYGLIYHASLVGQAPQKLKGKMARMVATKAALSIRLDALADAESKSSLGAPTIGLEQRAKLESRLRALEGRGGERSASAAQHKQQQAYVPVAGTASRGYNAAADAPPAAASSSAASSSAASKQKRKQPPTGANGAASVNGGTTAQGGDDDDDGDGAEADATAASSGKLSKEERRAQKEAKKAAKRARKSSSSAAAKEEEGQPQQTAPAAAANGTAADEARADTTTASTKSDKKQKKRAKAGGEDKEDANGAGAGAAAAATETPAAAKAKATAEDKPRKSSAAAGVKRPAAEEDDEGDEDATVGDVTGATDASEKRKKKKDKKEGKEKKKKKTA